MPVGPGDTATPWPRAESYIARMLDVRTCEEAMKRRDPTFDGVFYIGVKTTGIYCRPVCKARIPRRENVSFYPSAAAAERAGYRPCLRCRPETAPFGPAWNGTRTTVDKALRLIERGMLDRISVDDLADRLGVGRRHLSRLFMQHLGASPGQVAMTRRIQRAKRLLSSSKLGLDAIAEQAGFTSVRRMHAAISSLYGCPPSQLRGGRLKASGARERQRTPPTPSIAA